ncbi:MAG: 5'-nucleotidase protein [uncultured bacterium]|nr:MAG: 5'-nucleotidase protein [uncultured bacterium]HBH17547.1 hypothetical protein [Cyanobacteria bacterium UBA9579]
MINKFSIGLVGKITGKKFDAGIPAKPEPDVKTSILYINDLHSRLANMDGIKAKVDEFKHNNTDTDQFKLSGGDMKVGLGDKVGDLVFRFMNLIGIDLSAIGNHEFDAGAEKLQQQIDKINEYAKQNNSSTFKFVATNLDVNPNNALYKSIKDKKIVKSWVMTRNNHEYGFVGAIPTDLKESARLNPGIEGISIKNLKETAKEIQQEVDQLKGKNINKIVLLSHLGYQRDTYIAKNVSGIDVIVGGHSHHNLNGVNKGKNLILSPSKEPVIIVQGGKDGEYLGKLDVIFDSKGIIKSAKNNVSPTNQKIKDPEVEKLQDEILGKAEDIGLLKTKYNPIEQYRCENPLASFFCDAMKKKAGTQIALLINNSALITNGLNAGKITTRDIQNLSTFKDRVYKMNLSGKELQEILDWGVDKSKRSSPIQVSGMKYFANNGKTTSLLLEKSESSTELIEPDKQYSVALDEHIIYKANLSKAFNILKILESKDKKELGWDKGETVIEYIKSFNNKPFEVKPDNRIIINDSPGHTDYASLIYKQILNTALPEKKFAQTA